MKWGVVNVLVESFNEFSGVAGEVGIKQVGLGLLETELVEQAERAAKSRAAGGARQM